MRGAEIRRYVVKVTEIKTNFCRSNPGDGGRGVHFSPGFSQAWGIVLIPMYTSVPNQKNNANRFEAWA